MLEELSKTEPLTMKAIVSLSTEARKILAEKIRSKKKIYDFEYYPFPEEASKEYEEKVLGSYKQFIQDTKNKSMKDILKQEIEQDKIFDKKVADELKKMKKEPDLIPY
jgi:hypothetical protein